MSYKVDENKLMAYLYDELPADERSRVEQYLEDNPSARKELDELKEARFLMSKVSDREIEVPRFTFDQSEVVVGSSPTLGWWRYPLGVAASITVIFFVGYLTSFKLSADNDGWGIAFGETVTNDGYSQDQVEMLITQALAANNEMISQQIKDAESALTQQVSSIDMAKLDEALLNEYMTRLRDFNKQTLAQMLETSDQNQRDYTNRALQDLAIYLDIQRQNDLEVIQTQFESFENDAEINQLQTNQILTNLISSVGEQPNNQY